ncbi:MAG: signal peptidase II [Nanoarchaeota archaeon]|nr:signal peptidase II [Nanoarchaeota archaeon]
MVNKLLWISLSIIILDQLTKYLAPYYFPIVTNTGASFGILQGYSWLFIIITLIVVGIIIHTSNKQYHIAYPFIVGGALSNLIDRILYGHVIDFIHMPYWKSFPVFNLADVSITIGGVLLAWSILKGTKK